MLGDDERIDDDGTRDEASASTLFCTQVRINFNVTNLTVSKALQDAGAHASERGKRSRKF